MCALKCRAAVGIGAAVVLLGAAGAAAQANPVTAPSASAAAHGWSVTPSPNPRANNGVLNAVSCPATSVCTAVGLHVRGSGRGVTLAERRNGGRWVVQPTLNPRGAATSALNGVSCPSSSACSAVGQFVVKSGVQRSLAERWDGRSWHIQHTPNPARSPSSSLSAVACPAAHACVAVGTSNAKLLVERWTGSRWHIQRAPVPAGAQFSELNGVSCPAAASCVAVGDYVNSSGADVTLAERWNGSTWSVQPTPNPATAQSFSVLLGVSCRAPAACEAVGASDAGIVAERLNGTRWNLQAVPAPRGAQFAVLSSVSCAVSSCAAVGGYVDSSGAFVTLGERWNGTAWRVRSTPNPARASSNDLRGVSCPSSFECRAVGQGNGSGTPVTLSERWRDGRWSIEDVPSPVGAAENQLNGITCAATDACVAVGAAGPTRGVTSTEALHWNGRRWRIQPTPNPAGSSSSVLFGVACPAAHTCTAVGASNAKLLVERWTGSRWRIQRAPVPAGAQFSELNGVSCPSAASCVAVGDYVNSSGAHVTLAERWNGNSWRIVPTPTPSNRAQNPLIAVSCPASAACIAVGTSFAGSGTAGTFAERWNGIRWILQRTPTQHTPGAFLGGVWCQSATACMAAGSTSAGTLAERLSGTAWTVLPTPNPPGTQGDFFNNVSCTSLTACTSAGGTSSFPPQTIAERWNGMHWRIQRTPGIPGMQTLSSFGVACPAPATCIAAGGFENDGPGSVSLTERWRGTGTLAARPAPTGLSPRAYRGVADCIRAATDAGSGIGSAATRAGTMSEAHVPQRTGPVNKIEQTISRCRAA